LKPNGASWTMATFWKSMEVLNPTTWEAPSLADYRKNAEEAWNSTVEHASGAFDTGREWTTNSDEVGESTLARQGVSKVTTQQPRGGNRAAVADVSAVDDHLLCPLLWVDEPEGVTLTVDGLIRSEQQQEILLVRQKLRSGASSDLLLRAFVAEGGDRDGILMESVLGFQLAFIDTSNAFKEKDAFISLIRPGAAEGKEQTPLLPGRSSVSTGRSPWATIFNAGRHLAHVRRGGREGPLLMTVRTNPNKDASNVTDACGRLLASMVARRNNAGENIMVVQIGGGDAGLLLCALMAGLKLA